MEDPGLLRQRGYSCCLRRVDLNCVQKARSPPVRGTLASFCIKTSSFLTAQFPSAKATITFTRTPRVPVDATSWNVQTYGTTHLIITVSTAGTRPAISARTQAMMLPASNDEGEHQCALSDYRLSIGHVGREEDCHDHERAEKIRPPH